MTFKIKTLVSVYILQNEYQPNVFRTYNVNMVACWGHNKSERQEHEKQIFNLLITASQIIKNVQPSKWLRRVYIFLWGGCQKK